MSQLIDGHNFSKAILVNRLNKLGIPFDQNKTSKNDLAKLYNNSILIQDNQDKIKQELLSDSQRQANNSPNNKINRREVKRMDINNIQNSKDHLNSNYINDQSKSDINNKILVSQFEKINDSVNDNAKMDIDNNEYTRNLETINSLIINNSANELNEEIQMKELSHIEESDRNEGNNKLIKKGGKDEINNNIMNINFCNLSNKEDFNTKNSGVKRRNSISYFNTNLKSKNHRNMTSNSLLNKSSNYIDSNNNIQKKGQVSRSCTNPISNFYNCYSFNNINNSNNNRDFIDINIRNNINNSNSILTKIKNNKTRRNDWIFISIFSCLLLVSIGLFILILYNSNFTSFTDFIDRITSNFRRLFNSLTGIQKINILLFTIAIIITAVILTKRNSTNAIFQDIRRNLIKIYSDNSGRASFSNGILEENIISYYSGLMNVTENDFRTRFFPGLEILRKKDKNIKLEQIEVNGNKKILWFWIQ